VDRLRDEIERLRTEVSWPWALHVFFMPLPLPLRPPPPPLLVLYGKSLMEYPGGHENDFTAHGENHRLREGCACVLM
jgi:hypothetical protein